MVYAATRCTYNLRSYMLHVRSSESADISSLNSSRMTRLETCIATVPLMERSLVLRQVLHNKEACHSSRAYMMSTSARVESVLPGHLGLV